MSLKHISYLMNKSLRRFLRFLICQQPFFVNLPPEAKRLLRTMHLTIKRRCENWFSKFWQDRPRSSWPQEIETSIESHFKTTLLTIDEIGSINSKKKAQNWQNGVGVVFTTQATVHLYCEKLWSFGWDQLAPFSLFIRPSSKRLPLISVSDELHEWKAIPKNK